MIASCEGLDKDIGLAEVREGLCTGYLKEQKHEKRLHLIYPNTVINVFKGIWLFDT